MYISYIQMHNAFKQLKYILEAIEDKCKSHENGAIYLYLKQFEEYPFSDKLHHIHC